MSEKSERDAVRAEFYVRRTAFRSVATARACMINNMADEIVRQRKRADRAERILAALREPSTEVKLAARGNVPVRGFTTMQDMEYAITTAVAAAEKEVDAR